ncbi:MAG: DUF4446 family protein [Candidatus Niyogibacteria bacterium]|nr:DUF4446 family protein [Candidatus Niyogibacteria bacterium]
MNMLISEKMAIYAVLASDILALAAIVWLVAFEIRLRKLFRGRKAKDLEDVLKDVQAEIRSFTEKGSEIDATFEDVEKRLKRSAQNIGLVRFNPYSNAGGNQSFSLAVLDQDQNGFVLTNLYNREASRVYAKPVIGGESQHQLSEEEKEAIAKALG